MDPQKELGLGNLLRAEREKKKLTLQQVAEITRIRAHLIEALENEEWEKLPSRALVRGFIRSYAQSVGFEVQEAIEMFDELAPIQDPLPRSLVRREKKVKKKGYVFLFVILVLILLAAVLFLTTDWNFFEERAVPAAVVLKEKEPGSPSVETGKKPERQVDKTQASSEEPVEEFGLEMFQEAMKPVIVPEDIEPEILTEGIAAIESIKTEPPLEDSGPEPLLNKKYYLKAAVSMKTYLKIWVDDNPPKEYIFHPGSNLHWSADEGFNVVVGNAGGVEFDFNGEKTIKTGEIGKVRRLHFPEDFRSELYEN